MLADPSTHRQGNPPRTTKTKTTTGNRKQAMPTYHVELFEGRTIEQKRKLVEEVTRVTCETLGCSASAVDIIITDIKRENWSTGGQLWADKK
uniref:4-oxalocrotonate tautomerase n=1 Tax=Cupriavidus ulmosensis TaxID=3065913 RepID=UPI003F8656E8